MKTIRLFLIGLAAALCCPSRFTTANAEADPAAELADLKKRLAEQETLLLQQSEQIAALSKTPVSTEPAPAGDSEVSMLAKGAGLPDLKDVTWRMRAGLTAKQAVDAAVAQAAEDQRAKDAAARAGDKTARR